jgi:hypothetical protein
MRTLHLPRLALTLALSTLGMAACGDLPAAPAEARVSMQPPLGVVAWAPGDDPGPPVYALLDRQLLPHTEAWAAVIFVRDPDCVPAGFNLLDGVAVPQAFGCALTIEGHAVYKDGPPPPIQVQAHGLGAVPVWFVAWPELQAAIADDLLTISELSALPSLRTGVATFLTMSQQPGGNRPQGAGNGKIDLVARGDLTAGGAFSVIFREMGVEGVSILRHIAIDLP